MEINKELCDPTTASETLTCRVCSKEVKGYSIKYGLCIPCRSILAKWENEINDKWGIGAPPSDSWPKRTPSFLKARKKKVLDKFNAKYGDVNSLVSKIHLAHPIQSPFIKIPAAI